MFVRSGCVVQCWQRGAPAWGCPLFLLVTKGWRPLPAPAQRRGVPALQHPLQNDPRRARQRRDRAGQQRQRALRLGLHQSAVEQRDRRRARERAGRRGGRRRGGGLGRAGVAARAARRGSLDLVGEMRGGEDDLTARGAVWCCRRGVSKRECALERESVCVCVCVCVVACQCNPRRLERGDQVGCAFATSPKWQSGSSLVLVRRQQ